MTGRVVAILPLVFVAGIFVSSARAQVAVPVDLKEDYSDQVPVTGTVVVGVVLGAISGPLDPTRIALPISRLKPLTPVCVSTKTQDGQYWASAALSSPVSSQPLATLKPKNGWRYLQQLSKYSLTNFAPMARVGENCDADPHAPFLPVIFGSDRQTLTIFINDQRAISTRTALRANDTAIDGTCTPASPGIRSVAFNVTCVFDLRTLKPNSTTVHVQLLRRLRGGERQDDIVIEMP